MFTEEQLHGMFGAPARGGIRASLTSSDIILVRNAGGGCGRVGGGGRIICDGEYYGGKSDQMIRGNLRLAESQKSASRVLHFTKNDGMLMYNGLVEYVAHHSKDDSALPGALAFELAAVDQAVGDTAAGRQGGHGGPPGSRAPCAPDPDTIKAVERKISDLLFFASRSELAAALPMRIDPAELDRVLRHLERSARISTNGGPIRWSLSSGETQGGSGASKRVGVSPTAVAVAAAVEDPVRILSREERRSADLDNELPYSAEIEQLIADCEAGKPIGKTYAVGEYLQHLDHEFGDEDKAMAADGAV